MTRALLPGSPLKLPWPDKDCSDRTAKRVEQCVGTIDHIVDPTPLSGALQVAAIRLQAKHSQSNFKEEEFTSAIAGSFVATVPWFTDLSGGSFIPGFDQATYSKASRGSTGEGATGADFALLIYLARDLARVAVFQAKICQNGHTIYPHQISPMRPGKLPQPQLLRLANYGLKMMGTHSQDSQLDWVHYCGYGPLSSFCIPLDTIAPAIATMRSHDDSVAERLAEEIKQIIEKDPNATSDSIKRPARELWKSFKDTHLTRTNDSVDLAHLLAVGAAVSPDRDAPGWRKLQGNDIDRFIRSTSELMPILSASVNAGPSSNLKDNQSIASVVSALNESSELYSKELRAKINPQESEHRPGVDPIVADGGERSGMRF